MTDTTTPTPTTGQSSGQPRIWPTLRARDARGMIHFLIEALGFEELVIHADGDVVHHAELAWPQGGGVMLGSLRDDPDDPWHFTPGGFGCYVVTDDPDAVSARAVAAGAELAQPLHETDYGSRDVAVRDPEGNVWFFGTYRGEPRPAH